MYICNVQNPCQRKTPSPCSEPNLSIRRYEGIVFCTLFSHLAKTIRLSGQSMSYRLVATLNCCFVTTESFCCLFSFYYSFVFFLYFLLFLFCFYFFSFVVYLFNTWQLFESDFDKICGEIVQNTVCAVIVCSGAASQP